MLRVNECSAEYAGHRVLDPISLRVGPGQTCCIVGPSGCGKTTFLLCAAGLKTALAGSVDLDGSPVAPGDRRVGLILQQYGLFPWFTARENVALGLKIRGVASHERHEAAEAELARVGLAGLGGRYPRELSGGEQQRVAIARSMALTPRLLLMDEPFSALDMLTREALQEVLLSSLALRNVAVVLVTHSIEEAVYLGQSIVLFAGSPGRVVARIENPEQGMPRHRTKEVFFRRCGEVRAAMERAKAG